MEYNEPSFDLLSFKKDEEEEEKIKDKREEKGIHKGLKNDKGEILSENDMKKQNRWLPS